ncbi:MAG: hypothetical protein U5K30_10660 [Acidimicrobiales bacterium]|nr:hypothetical protein [Acidimicrobiales bacterium]
MDGERPPRLLPHLVLWGVSAVLAFMVLGWVIGAVFSILRTVILTVIVVAVVWAVVAIVRDGRR